MLTVRMFFSTKKVEDLSPLVLTTTTQKVAELNFPLDKFRQRDGEECIQAVLDQLGRPLKVEVDCRTNDLTGEAKDFASSSRQSLFKFILSQGYARDPFRRYTAVKIGKFKATPVQSNTRDYQPQPQFQAVAVVADRRHPSVRRNENSSNV